MKLSIISFTANGKLLSEDIAGRLRRDEKDTEVLLYTKHKLYAAENENLPVQTVEVSVGEWARMQLQEKNAMLFIGACGIAVRAVAPYLSDKLQDSPVLVMDEKGRYVIPLLSGHMGGANELALHLAEKTGAEPVITTATDLNHGFAVDLFAKQNGLAIANKDGIKKVSSKALAGQDISLCVECPDDIKPGKSGLPPGVRLVPYPPGEPVDVLVTSKEDTYEAVLLLRPRRYVVGLGCRKGKTEEELDQFINRNLNGLGIFPSQLLALASISQKQDEPGIARWCRRAGIPFLTYTAAELQTVEGDFAQSDFVQSVVGVGNVCERAALKACGAGGKLILHKYAENGITIAIAERSC